MRLTMRRGTWSGIFLCGVVLGGCGGGGSSPADAGPGGSDANPRDANPPDAEPPSSDDLIDEAVAAGTIADETGLVYHVYAAFGDQRLPAQYQGAGARNGTSSLRSAAYRWDSLSADTQVLLEPFTLPPSAPGNWAELPSAADAHKRAAAREIEWTKVSAQGGAVTVWAENRYPGEDALARSIAAELDARIWKKLTGTGADELGMDTPFPDDGLMNNGGDQSLDIYLVHMGAFADYGVTTPYKEQRRSDCGPWAQYMTINTQTATGSKLFPTVAHELMHAMQGAYKEKGACDPFTWWEEATATWVEDFVYPGRNSEWEYTNDLIGSTDVPLESTAGDHEYGAYLFPFLVYRKYMKPKFVTRSFELAADAGALDAIQAALAEVVADGMKGVFPEFALRNWNQDPVKDYQTWDHIPVYPQNYDHFQIRVDTDRHPLDTVVNHLAARYVTLTVSDPAVKRVTIDNSLFGENVPGGHVWLIAKIDGAYKDPEVLGEQKRYCRDRAGENVESMTLVISNWDWQHPGYTLPDQLILVSGNPASCSEYSGTIDQTISSTDVGTTEITVHAEPTYSPDETMGDGFFTLTANSWTFHALYDQPAVPCRTEQTAAGGFAPPVDSGTFVVLSGSPPQYYWQLALGNGATVTQVTNCNDQHQDETTTFPMSPTVMGINMPRDFEMDGSARGSVATQGSTLEWDLHP